MGKIIILGGNGRRVVVHLRAGRILPPSPREERGARGVRCEARPRNQGGEAAKPALGARSGARGVPNFRTYFVGAAVAQCGSWLLRTTQAWLVLDLTGSPAALGLVTAAQALPVTILTLFAGVLLDRTQARRLLLAVQLVFGVQAAILAIPGVHAIRSSSGT